MSDTEDVPELSPEAKAFLGRHAATGEPSTEGLERGRERLLALQKPAPTVSRRRPLVAPEVMAVAAVVVLLLGGQVIYLALRTTPVPQLAAAGTQIEPKPEPEPAVGESDAKAIIEAWRAGDYERADLLARTECRSTPCRLLAPQVGRALRLIERSSTLSDKERKELDAFERQIVDKGESISRREREAVKEPAPPAAVIPEPRAEALLKEAQAEREARNYERAALLLERCTAISPGAHACHRVLGSVYAQLATRDQSDADMEKARRAYQRFLAVAPEGDEYVPKVRAILDAASSPDDSDLVAQPAKANTLLVVGGVTTLPLERDIARVAVGDPAIVDLKVFGTRDLKLWGVGPGRTTVLVWFSAGGRESRIVEVKASPRADDKLDDLFAAASQAKVAGNWRQVFAISQGMLKFDPDHAGARRLIAACHDYAAELYHRGYVIRDRSLEEAIGIFKLVRDITVPEDDLHQKAQARIAELEK